ncbi:MAG: hypothetical protein A2036_00870 [Omnitrophica bacterium GWA2_50_21]|nr:MAG: hypothetical protein A2036_00870 [Omnitrophica bacterium GWA2_50_21]
MRSEWQLELDEINRKLASFDHADKSYYDRGVLFLKYAQKIRSYWKALKGDSYEEKILKGELLKVLLIEARLADGNLEYKFRKPFDELAKLLGSKQKEWGRSCNAHRTHRAFAFLNTVLQFIAPLSGGVSSLFSATAPKRWGMSESRTNATWKYTGRT